MIFFEYIILILLGLSIGSFANVCALRIPINLSLLKFSQCPHCNSAIKFYDNIPILSYLLLRGSTRCCGKSISLQYPSIEFLSMLMVLLIFNKYGFSFDALLIYYFMISLLIIFITDYKFFIIPDLISIPLIFLGVILSFLNLNPLNISVLDSIIAGSAAAILFFIISKSFFYLKKRDGLGYGDIKLIAALGFWTGVESTLIIVISSSILGVIFGSILILSKRIGRTDYLPYGCFIVCSSLVVVYLVLWQEYKLFNEILF